MTETITQDVFIDGASDASQLRVQGNTTQTQPLQTWEDSGSVSLARLTGTGKFQVGDLSLSTPEALIEASADLTSSSPKPKRGIHALGRFTGALGSALSWAVHELELLGSGGVTTLQTALRTKITNNNTGTVTDAEFRAGDFQAVNQKGGSSNLVKQITAVRASADTAANGYTAKAVAVEATINNDTGGIVTEAAAFEVATPENDGTVDTLYGLHIPDLSQGTSNFAIHTGEGVVHLGDHQELHIASSSPSDNPPTNFIKLYPKLVSGVPVLYAKDSSGSEYAIGSISAPLGLVGSSDVVQFSIKGDSTQTQDLQQWQKSDNTIVAQISPSGSLKVWGQTDDVLLFAKGSATQGEDLLQLQTSDAARVFTVSKTGDTDISGATAIYGQTDNVQLLVKGDSTQTQDLQQWQKSNGTVVSQISPSGKLMVWGQTDDLRLFAKATSDQTQDMLLLQNSSSDPIAQIPASGSLKVWGQTDDLRLFAKATSDQTQAMLLLQNSSGDPLHIVSATGATSIIGRDDNIQLLVQGNNTQTNALQEWRNGSNDTKASMDNDGKLTVTDFLVTTPAASPGTQAVGSSFGATEQAMLQTVYDALLAFGFIN